MAEGSENHEHGKKEGLPTAMYVLVIALVGLMAFNQLQLGDLQRMHAGYSSALALAPAASALQGSAAQVINPQSTAQPIQTASQGQQITLEAIAEKVIPRGVPPIYGAELGVSFDDPVKAMSILAPLDDGNPMPDKAQNARYVRIGLQISCEYCCGAPAVIFETGQAACSCAHSYSMRGLAKYLISKHGSEYTDAQILEEMGKWKIMFFPKQHLQKAMEFAAAGKDIGAKDLASNEFRGFKASTAAAVPASGAGIANLPNMVGGC